MAVQPLAVVESALKMFETESESHSIAVQNLADETFEPEKIDFVSVDPARLTQIFINLLTYAINFTKLEPVREITIRSSVFVDPVPQVDHINWFPANPKCRRLAAGPTRTVGEPVNLFFSISDTGKGLEQDEMAKLFHRFQQGTKKTHIKYGGSGLGLFISRELTEAMGGQIGLVTGLGKGSTFAFYVKAYRAAPPVDYGLALLAPLSPTLSRRTSSLFNPQLPIRPAGAAATRSSPPRLLLVEDNLINARVLTKQLEKVGCVVYNANHGGEALEFLKRTKLWHEYQPAQKSDTATALIHMSILIVC